MSDNWHGIGAVVEAWFSADRHGTFEINCAHIGGEVGWACQFGTHPQAKGATPQEAVREAARVAGADMTVVDRLLGISPYDEDAKTKALGDAHLALCELVYCAGPFGDRLDKLVGEAVQAAHPFVQHIGGGDKPEPASDEEAQPGQGQDPVPPSGEA